MNAIKEPIFERQWLNSNVNGFFYERCFFPIQKLLWRYVKLLRTATNAKNLQQFKSRVSLTLCYLCYYYAVCTFQSESTLYICLNIKQFHARIRSNIWSLRDSNGIRTQNNLVRKRTLNHLAKLANWQVWLNSWVFA